MLRTAFGGEINVAEAFQGNVHSQCVVNVMVLLVSRMVVSLPTFLISN